MDAVWKFCKSHRPYACGDQELGPEKLNSMVWSLLWVGCCNVSTSLLLNFEIETCLWTRGPSSCWMRAHHIFYIAIDARCDFDDCDQNTAQRTMLYSCRSSGEKNERQRWVWHHQGVRSPAIQIIIICYTLQTKHSVVEADRWRTKVAPPQLEVHGAKAGGGGIKLRLKISSLQKLLEVNKKSVQEVETELKDTCPCITSQRVLQASIALHGFAAQTSHLNLLMPYSVVRRSASCPCFIPIGKSWMCHKMLNACPAWSVFGATLYA